LSKITSIMGQNNCRKYAKLYAELMPLWTELVAKREIAKPDPATIRRLIFLYKEVLKKKGEFLSAFLGYEFVDLMPLVRRDSLHEEYYAGGQLECLQDAFDVNWIVLEKEDDYQGDWFAAFEKDGNIYLLNGYFGSCSSCDNLEGTNPIDWLRDNVKNVRGFHSKSQAVGWLKNTEDFSFSKIKNTVIKALGGTPQESEDDAAEDVDDDW
jgi:hypothetical protein